MSTSTSSPTFGGNGGGSFNDSTSDLDARGCIRQIVVRHGSEVDSLGVLWANGTFYNHGGTGGTEDTINLAPDEFISGVDGRSGDRLDQITFHSNKRRSYGPYGGGGGSPFTVDFAGKALQYLFGRSGSEIDQVAFVYGDQPAALPTTIVRSGEHGGTGGNPFDDLNAAGNLLGKITAITVRHGSVVDNIAVSYDGQPSNAHGGNGGNQDTFNLGSDEWLTEIRGRSGSQLDQVQFFLSSGHASPVYGGNGGSPFNESRAGMVVKAFLGRSGSLVDQVGFYFEDAKPLLVVITSLNYDLSNLNVLDLPPQSVMTVQLINGTSTTQQVSQQITAQTTDTDTTSVSETNELSVSFKVANNFLVTSGELTIGFKVDEQRTTGSSHAVQKTYSVTFQAMVPANSTVQGDCMVRQSTYDVPWTATANVTYQDRPNPVPMTLHGTLTGVATTAVYAQYQTAKMAKQSAA